MQNKNVPTHLTVAHRHGLYELDDFFRYGCFAEQLQGFYYLIRFDSHAHGGVQRVGRELELVNVPVLM